MLARKVLHTLFGVVLLGALETSSIGAMPNASKTTYFTFSKAVQLPGVSLSAGTYIFEVVNPDTSSKVVSVMSRDRSKLYLLRLTNRIERPRTGDLKPTIVFGEAPRSNPPAVKAWFPDGETSGREFIY